MSDPKSPSPVPKKRFDRRLLSLFRYFTTEAGYDSDDAMMEVARCVATPDDNPTEAEARWIRATSAYIKAVAPDAEEAEDEDEPEEDETPLFNAIKDDNVVGKIIDGFAKRTYKTRLKQIASPEA